MSKKMLYNLRKRLLKPMGTPHSAVLNTIRLRNYSSGGNGRPAAQSRMGKYMQEISIGIWSNPQECRDEDQTSASATAHY